MLNGDGGDLSIRQPLRDEHDTNGDAADEVLQEPFVVVMG